MITSTVLKFSDLHNTYYSAYRYVTKEDPPPCHSHNRPDLSTRPRTENAIAARKRKSGQSTMKGKKKNRRERGLTVYEVSQVIEKKNITKRAELVCLAVEQKREGNTRLAESIANRGAKAVDEALSVGKEFREAEAKAIRAKKTRIEILQEAKGSTCVHQCEGEWLEAALELMRLNRIDVSAFCTAIYNALQNGRGKYQNIFVYGPANSGKTFILSPLKFIYHAFCNPATGTFAWLGVDEAGAILLNDFRWNPAIIAWADLLQGLEGDVVHFPAPKNFCQRDIELSSDTPFFATSDAPMALVKAGSLDRVNTEMMDVRWRFFHFWREIDQNNQVKMSPCGKCFSTFVLDNVDI